MKPMIFEEIAYGIDKERWTALKIAWKEIKQVSFIAIVEPMFSKGSSNLKMVESIWDIGNSFNRDRSTDIGELRFIPRDANISFEVVVKCFFLKICRRIGYHSLQDWEEKKNNKNSFDD